MSNIFKIEDAGSGLIGHWFWFMLGALLEVENSNLSKFHFTLEDDNLTQYQKESLEILQGIVTYYSNSKFDFDLKSIKPKDNNLTKLHRIPFIKKLTYKTFINSKYIFFLQKIFRAGLEKNYKTKLKNFPSTIYIRRKNSQFSKGNANDGDMKNIIRRQIINEDDLCRYLETKNVFCIQAEDFHVGDKLLLFYNAKNIIAPNGGGLVYSFNCKKNTNIFEIAVKNTHQWTYHYHDISFILGCNWKRYSEVNKVDYYDNINVDIQKLDFFLKKNKVFN